MHVEEDSENSEIPNRVNNVESPDEVTDDESCDDDHENHRHVVLSLTGDTSSVHSAVDLEGKGKLCIAVRPLWSSCLLFPK